MSNDSTEDVMLIDATIFPARLGWVKCLCDLVMYGHAMQMQKHYRYSIYIDYIILPASMGYSSIRNSQSALA